MIRAGWGNAVLVTPQTNADPTPPAATAPEAARTAVTDPGGTDAWDRLAALAFDGAAAHGGCSAQAHACTCRAEHAEHAVPLAGPSS